MIETESQFVWKQIKALVRFPVVLLLFFVGRKSFREVITPIISLIQFVCEPSATISLSITILLVFLYQLFLMPAEVFQGLVFRPEHLFTLQPVPVISSWFLHGSWTHLLGNMLFLFVFGRIVERKVGGLRLLLIFFGSAVISSSIAGIAGQGGIGASGAIAGLVATAVLLDPFYLTYFFLGLPLPIFLVGWLVIFADIIGVLVPRQDNIGHVAHLGGYVAISVLIFLLSKGDRSKMRKGLMVNVILIAAWILAYYFAIPKIF